MSAAEMILRAKAEGRGALTEAESKQVLKAYGVPVVAEAIAATPEEAMAIAGQIGFPVVLSQSCWMITTWSTPLSLSSRSLAASPA